MAHNFKQRAEAWQPQQLQPNMGLKMSEVTAKMQQEQQRQELEAAQVHAQSKKVVEYTASRQLLKSEFERLVLLLLGAAVDDSGGSRTSYGG